MTKENKIITNLKNLNRMRKDTSLNSEKMIEIEISRGTDTITTTITTDLTTTKEMKGKMIGETIEISIITDMKEKVRHENKKQTYGMQKQIT